MIAIPFRLERIAVRRPTVTEIKKNGNIAVRMLWEMPQPRGTGAVRPFQMARPAAIFRSLSITAFWIPASVTSASAIFKSRPKK
jgi:hypothetical protein